MSKKNPGISRIDSGATHGWFVRVYRNGKTHSEFFADRKCKGKGKALSLATQRHAEMVKKLPPKTPFPRMMRKNASNRTGFVGVSRTTRKKPDGTVVFAYVASYRLEANVPKNKAFFVSIHGEKKAFALAVKFRRQMEKKIRTESKRG